MGVLVLAALSPPPPWSWREVMLSAGNVRQLAPYFLAFVVLVGSGVLLVVVDVRRFEQLLPFVTAIDGAVVAYVFAKEQTQVVQSGNGLERRQLDALHRRLDSELPAIREATGMAPAPDRARSHTERADDGKLVSPNNSSD